MVASPEIAHTGKRTGQAAASVAVVIPTKDRPNDLALAVSTVLYQTVLPRQLIIIDQSCDSASELRVRSLCTAAEAHLQTTVQLDYVRDTRITGASMARNRAFPLVRCEIVLFLDDDVVLERGFTDSVIQAYQQRADAAGISGIITNYSKPSVLFRWWSDLFVRGIFHDDRQPIYWNAGALVSSAPLRVTRFGGGLMSFRLSAVGDARFDDALSGACEGEDVDFCMHLPRPAMLFIAPRARLVHNHSSVGRTSEHWLALHCRTMWYLYRRNWNHGVWNRLCFVWLNIGYLLAALGTAGRHLSLTPWRALLQATSEARALARGGDVRQRATHVKN